MAKTAKSGGRKVAPPLHTPTDLEPKAVAAISKALNAVLADTFALFVKTKNFHWHISGPNFRGYHLLLDEHAEQLVTTIDEVAERVRKIGGVTIRSVGEISRLMSIKDNEADFVPPGAMLLELMEDNKLAIEGMRKAHGVCDDNDDVAGASLLENFIDQAEKRCWFLFESSRNEDPTGH